MEVEEYSDDNNDNGEDLKEASRMVDKSIENEVLYVESDFNKTNTYIIYIVLMTNYAMESGDNNVIRLLKSHIQDLLDNSPDNDIDIEWHIDTMFEYYDLNLFIFTLQNIVPDKYKVDYVEDIVAKFSDYPLILHQIFGLGVITPEDLIDDLLKHNRANMLESVLNSYSYGYFNVNNLRKLMYRYIDSPNPPQRALNVLEKYINR